MNDSSDFEHSFSGAGSSLSSSSIDAATASSSNSRSATGFVSDTVHDSGAHGSTQGSFSHQQQQPIATKVGGNVFMFDAAEFGFDTLGGSGGGGDGGDGEFVGAGAAAEAARSNVFDVSGSSDEKVEEEDEEVVEEVVFNSGPPPSGLSGNGGGGGDGGALSSVPRSSARSPAASRSPALGVSTAAVQRLPLAEALGNVRSFDDFAADSVSVAATGQGAGEGGGGGSSRSSSVSADDDGEATVTIDAARVGLRVSCRYGGGTVRYPGRITAVAAAAATVSVAYDDGDFEAKVPLRFVSFESDEDAAAITAVAATAAARARAGSGDSSSDPSGDPSAMLSVTPSASADEEESSYGALTIWSPLPASWPRALPVVACRRSRMVARIAFCSSCLLTPCPCHPCQFADCALAGTCCRGRVVLQCQQQHHQRSCHA